MNKFTKAAVLISALVLTSATAYADDISVTVNGTRLEPDAPPFIADGRTLVPVRAIFEALGAEVVWDAEYRTVHAYGGDNYIAIQILNPIAYVNNESVVLDTPAVIENDRTFVPVRFIAEALGAEVDWDESAREVIITTQ